MKLVPEKIIGNDAHYFVPSSSASFNQRQKSIFDELDKAEKVQPPNRYSQEEFREAESRSGRAVITLRRELRQFQGKESIFKRPEIPLKRKWKGEVPDFRKNPHKWTKYTLEDVSAEDLTDKSNTATAMAFLKEMASRSDQDTVMETETGKLQTPHFIFNKPIKSKISEDGKSSEGRSLFISGKFTMPEYVIGQKIKPKKNPKKPEIKLESYIKLDHLFNEEEEENVE